MSISAIEPNFDESMMWLDLSDGRKLGVPLPISLAYCAPLGAAPAIRNVGQHRIMMKVALAEGARIFGDISPMEQRLINVCLSLAEKCWYRVSAMFCDECSKGFKI